MTVSEPSEIKILDAEKLDKNISETALKDISAGKIPGCSVIVYQKGKKLFEDSYGYTNIYTKKPIEKNTLFRLASMTKPVTAVAVLLQLQKNKLKLEDKVSKYFPGFCKLKIEIRSADGTHRLVTPSREVTLLDLLTHTGGFGSDETGTEITDAIPSESKSDLLSAVKYYEKEMMLSFDPGSMRSYSPVAAFDVLAAIVSLTSGREIDEFMQENIFSPLGMTDTSFAPDAEKRIRFADMFSISGGIPNSEELDEIFSGFPLSYHAGGAGLAGTADDYSAFAEMLCDSATGRKKTILKKESADLMRTAKMVPSDINENPSEVFGLGVRTTLREKTLPEGVFGWSGAYGTHFWVDPANEITAVYMKNSFYDGGAGCMTAIQFEKDVMNSLKNK